MVSTVSALQCCFSKDKACMVNSTAKYFLSSKMCVTVVCSTVVSDCCEWLCDVLCLGFFCQQDVSSCVLLYNLGSALDDQQVYMSSNGGNSFFNLPMAPKATVSLDTLSVSVISKLFYIYLKLTVEIKLMQNH